MKKLLIILFCLFPYFLYAQTITGKVIRIADGDTFTILSQDNKQERIRLDAIDAPEKGQDFSEKSRQHLASFIEGKTVNINYKTKDMYGRILGTVFINDTNINYDMVRQGLAWQYRYNRDKNYAGLQAEAQANKRNIWSIPNPVPPWEWRKKTTDNSLNF
jgi:micrococcal nuclease